MAGRDRARTRLDSVSALFGIYQALFVETLSNPCGPACATLTKRLLKVLMAVLLMLPQTIHNEVVYSAWMR
jgi:hypothetical protein